MTAITLWGVGALYFSPLLPARWRAFAAASYGTASILAFALLPYPGRTAIAALAIFAVLVILFLRIPASNDRDWQPDVAVTPYATVNGDLVTIHGVRNFDLSHRDRFYAALGRAHVRPAQARLGRYHRGLLDRKGDRPRHG